LASGKANQYDFGEFLFHLMEAAVCTEFVSKKILFLTDFPYRKLILWKTRGLSFGAFSASALTTTTQEQSVRSWQPHHHDHLLMLID